MNWDIRYKHLETALGSLHLVPPEAMKTFRARIRNLRKLGVPAAANVGSGRQISYSSDQVYQLFLALELTEFEIPPATIATIIADYWHELGPWLSRAAKSTPPRYLVLSPLFLTEIWGGKALSGLHFFTKNEIVEGFLREEDLPPGGEPHGGGGSIILPLTKQLAKFEFLLEEAVHRHA